LAKGKYLIKDIPELFPISTLYPLTPPLDVYIVFSYWTIGRWWKMFPNQFLDQEKAQEFIDHLPAGYGERRIFHVKK